MIPFHAGERVAQRLAGFDIDSAPIRDFMPDQHRTFFATLPFLLVGAMAEDASLQATILTGPPGFMRSPDPETLAIGALPDAVDPFMERIHPGAPLGMLGIELATRRRNRANGRVAAVGPSGFDVTVLQSFGNCPKYIQQREVTYDPALQQPGLVEHLGGLDAAARQQIGTADTLFVASSSGLSPVENGGVDISHRGGPPGFVTVAGDRLTVPDFVGNRYFNTLGNFVQHPQAALLLIDFDSGDLLHLSGAVALDWQAPAHDTAQRSWRLTIESAWRRRRAVPLRARFLSYAPTTLAAGGWR